MPMFHADRTEITLHSKNHADQALPFLVVPIQRRSSSGLDLGKSLVLLEAPLLLQPHNLEAVEVGEGLAALLLEGLLGPVALLPLSVDTSGLPSLLDGTRPGTTGKLLDDDGCEEGPRERNGAAGSGELGVGGRSIDKHLLAEIFSSAVLSELYTPV